MVTGIATISVVVIFRVKVSLSCQMFITLIGLIGELSHNVIVCQSKPIVNLRNRTGEERRRQTLCDNRDDNFFQITFHQTSLSFKQIFL